MTMDDKLPYDFDLAYDIKYRYELVREYLDAKAKMQGLADLCGSHDIPIPTDEESPYPPLWSNKRSTP